MSTDLFRIKKLKKFFISPNGDNKCILDIEQLALPKGSMVAIIGPSGSGKTTLLNILAGLEQIDEAEEVTINIDKQIDLTGPGDYPRNNISFIFQEDYLLKNSNVGLNISISRSGAGYKSNKDVLQHYLQLVELDHSSINLDHHVYKLSGGEQQRVGFARALAREADVIFADEPTSSVDPVMSVKLMASLRRWQIKEKSTVIWVTHDYKLITETITSENGQEKALIDYLYVLENGKLKKQFASQENGFLEDSRDNCEVEFNEKNIREQVQSNRDDKIVRNISGESIDAESMHSKLNSFQQFFALLTRGIKHAFFEMFSPNEKKNILSFLTLPLQFYANYRHILLSLIALSILFLCFSIALTQKVVESYFVKQLEKPEFRHVVVSGNVEALNARLDLETISYFNKNKKDWLKGCTQPGDLSSYKVYGRLSGSTHTIIGSKPNGSLTEKTLDIQLLKASLNEDVIKNIYVKDINGKPLGLLSSLQFDADQYQVILDSKFYEKIIKKFKVHDTTKFPVIKMQWGGGNDEYEDIEILGIADDLPKDREYLFNGFMPLSQYEAWTERFRELPHGQFTRFHRGAFYFNPPAFQCLNKVLREREYLANWGIFQKIEELLKLSESYKQLFTLVQLIGLNVSVLVMGFLLGNYIKDNEQPFALLKAQGVSSLVFNSSLILQTSYIWIFALLHLFLIVFLIDYFSLVSFLPDHGKERLLQHTSIWLQVGGAILFSVILVFIIAKFMNWRNKYLIKILKQG